jgi:hypothetical protein
MAAASIVAFLVEKLGSVIDDTDAIKFLPVRWARGGSAVK